MRATGISLGVKSGGLGYGIRIKNCCFLWLRNSSFAAIESAFREASFCVPYNAQGGTTVFASFGRLLVVSKAQPEKI